MNYVRLIEHFWATRLEHSFSCNDIAVYFALVDHCNKLSWKNPFNFSVDELQAKLRLKTKDPLDTARNRLKQAGLLDFKNGQGRGYTTQYYLTDPDRPAEKGGKKGQKNTPYISPFSPPFIPPFSPLEKPPVLQTKLNKTNREATASPSQSADKSDQPLTPAEQQLTDWQAWATDHAPRLLHMPEQPTAAALAALYGTFSKPAVLDICLEMHNWRKLLDTKNGPVSVVGTARAWLLKRQKEAGGPAPATQKTTQSVTARAQAQHQRIPE